MDHRYAAIDCNESASDEQSYKDYQEFAQYCDMMEQKEREQEDFEEANMELLACGG